MKEDSYFKWLLNNTKTTWWHDSADPLELAYALENGASGVTTNPMLCFRTLASNPDAWSSAIQEAAQEGSDPVKRAASLVKSIVQQTAIKLLPQYEASNGNAGYVCAQVNPACAGDRDAMYGMAREFGLLASNISVKLPVTFAGLDVLERCVAEGISVTATVSFTVPQVLAVAESYQRGIRKARDNNITPGKCFAVIMIGRIDDYLRDVAKDRNSDLQEEDLIQAGLAITKRAYSIYKERGYEAVLLIAALRGDYHLTELAGAEVVMSIAPNWQQRFLSSELNQEQRIGAEIPSKVISRLQKLSEFNRAYEPKGMEREDFIGFGATQRTLSQFVELGWRRLESYSGS